MRVPSLLGAFMRRWRQPEEDTLPVLVVTDEQGHVALVVDGEETRAFEVVNESQIEGEAA